MNFIKEFQEKYELDADGIIGKNTLLKIKEVLSIENNYQLAHFVAQCDVESAEFTTSIENLNYSVEGLLKTFPKYFNRSNVNKYARQPEKIANRVYANRMGNGDELSGDGWQYRGAGFIQLTGKDNQTAFMSSVGISDNSLIASDYALESAKWYFDTRNVFKWCSEPVNDSILNVSRLINVGNINSKIIPIGLNERINKTMKYYEILT